MFGTHLVCLIKYLLAVKRVVGCYVKRNFQSHICFVSQDSLIAGQDTAYRLACQMILKVSDLGIQVDCSANSGW